MTIRLNVLRLLVMTLMVGGVIAPGLRPVHAQVSGESYTDPEYGWHLSWDGDVWTVVDNPAYDLVLWNQEASYVFFENRDDWGDAEDCLDGRIDEVEAEAGVDDLEPLEDANGDPLREVSRGRAFAAYSLTYTNPNVENARPVERVNAIECRVLVPGDAVLAMTHVSSARAYDDDADLVAELLSNLDLAETDEPAATPEEDEPAATPEEDDEPTATPEEDELTATPEEDEPTATPEDEEPTATPEEEDEPTATPERDATETQVPDPEAGIDGNTYTSPTYGFTIEWDEDVWSLDITAGRFPGRDTLVLDFVEIPGYVYIEAYDAYDGDPEECLEGSAAEVLESTNAENVTPYEDEDGNIVEGEEDGMVFAAYTLELNGDEVAAYFDCRTLIEDEAVLAVSMVTLQEDFADARAELDDLLATLELAEVQGTITPADDEAPTPDDQPTATPEEGDDVDGAGTGVDGNTYESPTYGFTLEWDEDVWEVDDASSEGGVDVLVLISDGSAVSFRASEAFGGDAEACVEAAEDEIADRRGVEDVALLEDEDGPIFEGDEDYAYAYYGFTIERPSSRQGEYYEYVECSALDDGESVLRISQTALIDDAEEEIDALLELLDNVELVETSAVRDQTGSASTATAQAIAENEAQPAEDTNHCQLVELYPGYPGYRGYVTGVDGVGDHACLHDLEAADPFFSRSDEDRENRAAARQLDLDGEFDTWTWENWLAVEAERGMTLTCYACLIATADQRPEPRNTPIQRDDPRLLLGEFEAETVYSRYLAEHGISRFGASLGDYQLRAIVGLSNPGRHLNAIQLLEAYDDVLDAWFTPGQRLDPGSLCTPVLEQGGYFPVPENAAPEDQMFAVFLYFYSIESVVPPEFYRGFMEQFERLMRGWQDEIARGGRQSLAEYLRAGGFAC